MTQLPAAAQLTGEARTRVQELISNFNQLITIGADWRESFAMVESNLAALLGPEPPAVSGTTGAVGTNGTGVAIDPAIRDMLVAFRDDLKQFERVASGSASPQPAAAPTASMTPPRAPLPTPAADERPDARLATTTSSQSAAAPRDVLLHVEAIEVILGAQTAAQKAATAAAGGAVVSKETASGSTRTTITGPNVTLTFEQLNQITTHLKEIRRLLETR